MPAAARRGLGWHRDPAKAPGATPDRLARPRLGLAPPPLAASCRHLILSILDQGGLGSCVANAGMQALRASMVQQGVSNPPLGSRLWGYYFARAYDHDVDQDNGTFIRNFFQACVKFGYPTEADWPYSDDTGPAGRFRIRPPMSADRSAFDQSSQMSAPLYERINTTGLDRILDVKRAIASGHVVVFGTRVSDKFCDGDLGTGPIQPPIGVPIAGGHAMLYAAYEPAGVWVPNSWGEGWGDRGWCLMSWDYVAWPSTADLWIVDTAPQFAPLAAVA